MNPTQLINSAPDADMQRVLDEFAALNPRPLEQLTPEEARLQPTPADAVKGVLAKAGRSAEPTDLVPGVTAMDRMVSGAAGPISARIYTPQGEGPFPVVVYFHGGGWVIADKDVYDGGARGLAQAANAIVISADYRRAPEHKFPAAHEDALAVYRWAAENAASIQGDPTRLALAGESAGGNLAVATAVAVTQNGDTAPAHVLAVYPVAQTGTTTDSYLAYADAKPLGREGMEWFVRHATRSPEDLDDARLNLIEADFDAMPPVTIINAEIDPLRDDGKMLEDALERAGVSVERRLYPGVAHEFFGMAAVVTTAREAQQFAGKRLKSDLHE